MGASSRVRGYQFLEVFRREGIECRSHALLDDRYVRELYAGERSRMHLLALYARRVCTLLSARPSDLLWIEKELLPFLPYAMEAFLISRRRYVVDLDDAIFHNYDLSRVWPVRKLFGRKIDALMRGATLVTVGNSYLEARARAAGARWIERIPSVIDLDRYQVEPHDSIRRTGDHTLRVVWIGSPATARYLERIRIPMERLASTVQLAFHVIGARAPAWSGVNTQEIPWSADTEVAHLKTCDIGVMPLDDSPWERGKCGFKLIQYMACGLPVVASPVGMNLDIVASGVDGYLAREDDEWFDALRNLAVNPALRDRMGHAGRAKVEQHYCVQVVGPHLAGLLKQAAGVSTVPSDCVKA